MSMARHFLLAMSLKKITARSSSNLCADDDDAVEASLIFFSEPIFGPPNEDFSRENAKMNVKKSDIARTSPSERFVC